jgi:alkylation response protein AidB-like acyl-CoA dehydrogenase
VSDTGISVVELRESIREVLSVESDLTLVRAAHSMQSAPALDALWAKFAALGWFGLAVPEEYGGLGLGLSHLAQLFEELGQFLTPLPVMTTLLAAAAVAKAGSEQQKSQWLPRLAAGEIRASLALPTSAVGLPRLDDTGLISGVIEDVLQGDQVEEILIPVQHPDGKMGLAMVARTAAGVQITARPLIDPTRTLAEVRLSNAPIAADRLLPLNGRIWTQILDHLCIAIASDAVGGTTRILADTVAYLSERRQFGRPIGSFQALKHRVASWKIQLEGITALTRHSAGLVEEQEPTASGLASAAKATATDTYVKVAGDAVQLHGGIGFTWEHECHLFLKRATLNAALFGGVLQHKDRAACFAFGEALSSRRPAAHESLRRFFSQSD